LEDFFGRLEGGLSRLVFSNETWLTLVCLELFYGQIFTRTMMMTTSTLDIYARCICCSWRRLTWVWSSYIL